jgi:hypothetical protein
LNWFDKQRVPADEVYEELNQRAALGDERDLMQHLREHYGDEEAERFKAAVNDDLDAACDEVLGSMGRQLSSRTTAPARDRIWLKERPRLILMNAPDALFATAVEGAVVRLAYNSDLYYDAPPPHAPGYVNEVFEKQGVPYRLSQDGQMEWVGDEAVHELVVEPALTALRDPRLDTPAEDFGHAVANLRRGTVKSRKDAVNDATKALEGTLAALLEANGHTPGKRQVFALWTQLREHDLVPNEMEGIVTGGSKVSNARGRHSNPDPVEQAEAEASVSAVGVAVTYLASLLP